MPPWDPRALDDLSAGADVAIAALTGLKSSTSSGVDEDGEYWRMFVGDPDEPLSWATATWRPGSAKHAVQQVGERPVWDEVLQAYAAWVGWGEPSWRDFGITITSEGQQIWLNQPDNVLGRQEV
ncbi:hypothetical protein ABZ897_54220 [Nonomuraea sp. NPDC046802]|uniref:hypothetical protein n=1 Tax=Nonomuraea sp. NPDC046802 TaxID=3154919 RepID=UPI0033E6F8BE